ncbi:MAG: hypothetical protein R3249_05320, partial [Nitriliruptorales bacterium]|nr:hypothetical protein [Nitriliruptorales bacterium]
MSDEIAPDQGVYDALIAQGVSERIARAKAKAATQRKVRQSEGWQLGPRDAAEAAEKLAAYKASAGAGGGGGGATATATAEAATGRLSPEERAARVAASLGNGGAPAQPGVA